MIPCLFLLLLCSFIATKTTVTADETTSLRVFYMVPQDEDTIYNLNEKSTFGNSYINGWILPSAEKLTLNIYIYYDGNDVQRLNSIYNLYNKLNSTTVAAAAAAPSVILQKPLILENNTVLNQTSNTQQQGSMHIKETLYMYFTTEKNSCNDFHTEQHIPLKFQAKLADNMYKGQITVRLQYAAQPYFICMQQIDYDENIYDQNRHFHHQGNNYWLSIITTKDLLPVWSRIAIFLCLLCLSGLFSGLNLGLMSLDISELEILKRIGTAKERSYAAKIYPLRKRGNYLLCTILLGNVLVNSTSTLILGDLLSGIYAALGSTILIVLFGEIIPQAACSKHGLAVGAHTRIITIFFMILTGPISFPLSKILDLVLGKEIAATYNREKIRELMKNVKDLEEKEMAMISGALDFNKRTVNDIMRPLSEVFMLEVNSKLDFATIVNIQQKGFSRIPVFETTRENVVGLLHVKDFTLLDPDDNMPVKALLDHYNHKLTMCYKDDKLDDMFEKFRLGETHLAFVIATISDEEDKDPYTKCVGIITLEDIIEELVQLEIYDEFDDKKDLEKELLQAQIKKKRESSGSSSTISNVGKSKSKESSSRKPSRLSHSPPSNNSADSSKANSVTALNVENEDKNGNKTVERQKSTITSLIHKDSSANLLVTKTQQGGSQVQKYETQASYDLSFFLQQQAATQSKLISPQLSLALFQFLSSSVRPFVCEFLTKNVLELIFKRGDVFKESRRAQDKLAPEYLYQYGKKCNYFIIILNGEATIEVGHEKLEFVAGQFAYFGVNALVNDTDTVDQVLQGVKSTYTPDFSLRVDDRCVYFKIDRDLWFNGVKKSRYEKENNSDMSNNIDMNSGNMLSTINSGNNTNPDSVCTTQQPSPIHKAEALFFNSTNDDSNTSSSTSDVKKQLIKKASTESLNDDNSENKKTVVKSPNKLAAAFNMKLDGSDKKKSSECIELITYKEEHDD